MDSVEGVGQFVGALGEASFEVAVLVSKVGNNGETFFFQFLADIGFENDGVEVGSRSATRSEDEAFIGSHSFFGEVARGGFSVRFGATGEEDDLVSEFDGELIKFFERLDCCSFGSGHPSAPDFGLIAPVRFFHVRKIREGGFIDIEDDRELFMIALALSCTKEGGGPSGSIGEILLVKLRIAVIFDLLLEGGKILGFVAAGGASKGCEAGEKENAFHRGG